MKKYLKKAIIFLNAAAVVIGAIFINSYEKDKAASKSNVSYDFPPENINSGPETPYVRSNTSPQTKSQEVLLNLPSSDATSLATPLPKASLRQNPPVIKKAPRTRTS